MGSAPEPLANNDPPAGGQTIFTKQAKKWSSLKIHSLLQNTYKLEVDIKSNLLIDKKILIKKLIIDICKLANAS